jgi:hypothetical protein
LFDPEVAPPPIDLEAVSVSILLQRLKVILSIGITAKNDLALIASTDHMIKRPGKFNSRFSCHDAAVSHSPGIMHYESLIIPLEISSR